MIKLLDTSGANTKLRKNNRDIKLRVAGLSLMPDDALCPMKLCAKNVVEPWVRLNVISDVQWELKANGSIPQSFPDIKFFDYTKLAKRLGNTPDNYDLMFSWSGAKKYQDQVNLALKTDAPMSAVFHGPMPETFLGRTVVSGDNSDIENIFQPGKILGLKYKLAKGQSINPIDSVFIVNTKQEAA